MKKTKSAGGVVVNTKGEVLVVNQNGNSWSLPKGHLNAGESHREAAAREIYEESGIQNLEFVRPLGEYTRYRIGQDGADDKTELKKITLFLFKTAETRLEPRDPKNPEARWCSKSQTRDLLTHPQDKEFFKSIEKLI